MIDKGSEIRSLVKLEEELESNKADLEKLKTKLESESPRDEVEILRVEKKLNEAVAELGNVISKIAQLSHDQDKQLR